VILSPETLLNIFNLSVDDIDCSGLKLHLDKVFTFKGRGGLYRNTKNLPEVDEIKPNEKNLYILKPGAYKIRYKEVVKVPENTIALAIPRSTLLRAGATIYTAVWDPGYNGRGEGLMVVFNLSGIEIEVNAQIAQLIFIYMDKTTRYTYRGSYQNENIVYINKENPSP